MNHIYSQTGRAADACALVIFGARGDLTRRKLLPALYNLAVANLLPKRFAIVGYASAEYTEDAFCEKLTSDIRELGITPFDPRLWDWFLERIHYIQGDFADPEGFQRLSAKLADVERDHGTLGNRFFYLAVAPQFFAEVVRQLGAVAW